MTMSLLSTQRARYSLAQVMCRKRPRFRTLQITDQVVDVPVKSAAQVPRVLVVEKTTEIPQFGAAELLVQHVQAWR